MTAILGVFLDAWDEVRVHRARVVLSLIGIVLAVFAMTSTTAAGMIFKQIVQEQAERFGGRDATITVRVYSGGSATLPEGAVQSFYDSIVRRYGVKYNSEVVNTQQEFRLHGVSVYASIYGVDADYGLIHRFIPESGRWLAPADAARLAPSVVVNEKLLTDLGLDPTRPTPYTLDLPEPAAKRVVVVGVTRRDEWTSSLWVLNDDLKDVAAGADLNQAALELWLPPAAVDQLTAEIKRLIRSSGFEGDVQPPMNTGLDKVLLGIQVLIFALSLFALFLGALGVLNVGVVTVRQRIREIGVRRALGASSRRIFAAVMLESVLATALAGLLGIALAIALVNNFPYEILPRELSVTEDVPFPVGAAVQAFVTATVIGALVGLVPATVAVRSRVIDAIRY